MNDHDIDVIVEKVRKLLALSKSPNHHEATLAAQRAHDLIMKHNLTMDHLEECEIERHSFGLHKVKPKRWRLVIATSVAEYYFCKFLLHETNYQGFGKEFCFLFIGKRHHVLIAESIYNYLEAAIVKITRDNVRKNAKFKFRESFRYGMAVEIGTRLKKLKQDREKYSTTVEEHALIVREDEQVEKVFQSLRTGSHEISQPGLRKNAFERGVDAGAGVGLSSQMTHNTRRIAQ